MLYVIAFLIPPLAIFLCGRKLSALLNFVLWIAGAATVQLGFGYGLMIVAIVHAIFVVRDSYRVQKQDTF
jgi:uncharacterized membrane protein YqaE (UPF0057 family)